MKPIAFAACLALCLPTAGAAAAERSPFDLDRYPAAYAERLVKLHKALGGDACASSAARPRRAP
jgi:hypothetical protein